MYNPEMFQSGPANTIPQNRAHPYYVKIIEQPSRSLRYRYDSEGRPGIIPGASSTPENKNPFAIEIVGYEGRVVVVVSCVTKDRPYRPHPHNLMGQNCKNGVCYFEKEVTCDNPVIAFPKLAVQCVKRNAVKQSLKIKEEKNVDPFLTGFDHKNNDIKSIDLHVVRLCFQVFLKGESRHKVILNPVVSDPIYNKKTIPDPLIYRISHCNAHVDGGKNEIILLCTKVIKEDVKIRFFELQNQRIVWEDFGIYHPNHIYNNTAICFRPPKYHNQNITEPAKVSVQLVRPSDGLESPPLDFEYLPLNTIPGVLKEKRRKYSHQNPLWSQFCLQNDLNQVTEEPKTESDLLGAMFLTKPQPPTVLLDLPNINMASNQPSTSRRSSGGITTWNIISDSSDQPSTSRANATINSEDLSIGADVNLDSARAVCEVLNVDYNQIMLEPLHISSGDLEMADVDTLSGTLQESLVI